MDRDVMSVDSREKLLGHARYLGASIRRIESMHAPRTLKFAKARWARLQTKFTEPALLEEALRVYQQAYDDMGVVVRVKDQEKNDVVEKAKEFGSRVRFCEDNDDSEGRSEARLGWMVFLDELKNLDSHVGSALHAYNDAYSGNCETFDGGPCPNER